MKRTVFFALATALLLTACPGRNPDFVCRADGNCVSGFICVDGACVRQCGADAGSCPDAGDCTALDGGDDAGAADAGSCDGGACALRPAGYCAP